MPREVIVESPPLGGSWLVSTGHACKLAAPMPAANEKRLLRAIASYSQFNSERTLGVGTPSEFQLQRLGDVLVLCDPARPRHPLFNRVLGLGAGAGERQVEAALAVFDAAGCEPHFELSTDAIVPELVSALVERGFEPAEAIQYLQASPGSQAPKRVAREIVVARWEHDQADAFRELLQASGVRCEDEIWEHRRELYCTDGFRIFVAKIEGEPIAWASTYIDRDARGAYLANAFTLPEFRNRGCHLALLQARLEDARGLGAKAAYTDVVPDTSSARNCRRAGFKTALTLTLWRR